MSLKPLLGRLGENHKSELYMELCNSRLGEMDPLGRDLQGFVSVHAPTSLKSYQNINQSLSRQRPTSLLLQPLHTQNFRALVGCPILLGFSLPLHIHTTTIS
ncbi:hypothetical protein DEO72_LG3g2363 [Vigna unguiculata]|uniref:Uncharacterized protein n=1 Tax=Vigna unguiculata TaxID=3917 RepID=A0A4D6LH29_VIGUN|nr:hypothetical protein DEO72_LG3g2363 [Vigna unguiculata]